MQRQLAAIIAEFESARQRLHRLSGNTADDRWAVRSDERSWSVAECVAHLNITSHVYVPLLRSAMEAAPAADAPPRRYRRDPIGWLLSVTMGPLPGIGRFRLGRVRTAPRFLPSGELRRDALVPEFDELQDLQIELTREAQGKPIDSMRIVSPFDARAKYNVFSALVILPRHQHRHLAQAERVWQSGVVPT